MTITHTATAIHRVAGRPDGRRLVRARELSATTMLVAALGEVDAAVAHDLYGEIAEHLSGYRQLVLDLSHIDFFGTAGYALLHRVHAHCVRAGMDWVLVAGPEVERLLRVCDPEGIFPAAANIVSAVALLARGHAIG